MAKLKAYGCPETNDLPNWPFIRDVLRESAEGSAPSFLSCIWWLLVLYSLQEENQRAH